MSAGRRSRDVFGCECVELEVVEGWVIVWGWRVVRGLGFGGSVGVAREMELGLDVGLIGWTRGEDGLCGAARVADGGWGGVERRREGEVSWVFGSFQRFGISALRVGSGSSECDFAPWRALSEVLGRGEGVPRGSRSMCVSRLLSSGL